MSTTIYNDLAHAGFGPHQGITIDYHPTPVVIDRGQVYSAGAVAATTTIVSASFTPSPGSLLIVRAFVNMLNATALLSISDSFGGTSAWQEVITVSDGRSGYTSRLSTFVATVGASPVAGTITVTRTAGNVDYWMHAVFTEIVGGGIVGVSAAATNKSGSTSLTVNLASAPAATSIVLGYCANDQRTAASINPPASLTETHDVAVVWGSEAEAAQSTVGSAAALTWTFPTTGAQINFANAIEILPPVDWRFIVRIARPTTNAVLGNFILGTDVLSDIAWLDITTDVEVIDLQRGSTTAGDRVGARQLSMTLKNNSGNYSPWKSLYYGPGTLMQVGIYKPTGNISAPLFTGFTVAWNESQMGHGSSRWIDVEALETMSVLGEYDPPAISPIGAGENYSTRFGRILGGAHWAFNYFNYSSATTWDTYTVDSLPSVSALTLQATALADDALTELFTTCDSLGIVAVPGKNGDVQLWDSRIKPSTTTANLGTTIPIVADSIVTANDDEQLLGGISLSITGGTATTFTNTGIGGRYQSRIKPGRYDLIGQAANAGADLSRIANDLLLRSRNVYRVNHLELDSLHGSAVWEFLVNLDVFYPVNIYKADPITGGTLFTNYAVCGYTLHIEPLNKFKGIHITASIETEPTQTATYAHTL